MPIKLPNGKFRVQIRVKGHPRVDQVFDSKKAAADFEKDERERIEKNAPLYTLEMTFREAWRAYHGSLRFRAKKETTQRTEESRIERALKALGEYSLAQLVDGQIISRFRDELAGQRVKVMVRRPEGAAAAAPRKGSKAAGTAKATSGRKPALVPGHRRDGKTDGTLSNDGQRLVLAAVSSVMLWAVEQRIMVYNPVRGLKKPKPGERERRMERDEELNIFLLAKNERNAHERLNEDARFVAIQRELGCRPGELSKVLRHDIDLAARAIRFRDTKNGDTRVVHIIREAGELLGIQMTQAEVQHPDSPYLFTSRATKDGAPVPFAYTMAIKRLREAGIVGDDFYAHAARREFASGSFEAGLPVEDIRKQTGHKSIKALEAYNKSDALHPDARARVEAVGALRASERYDDLAAALGVSSDQLREFQRQNAVVPLRVVGETIAKAAVARPMRKPVSRVLPKGAKKPATGK